MALARPRLWLVYKLVGEHCLAGLSAAPRAPAAAATAAPPTLTLLDRLRLMGIAEAGATRVKPGESRARRCFHVVSPLDVGSRGLVLCTTSAALAQLLAARPATLARHLGAEDVYLRSRGGGSSAAQPPLPPATAAAIAASRATIVTRRYRARLGALALAPHLAAAFASGRYGGSAGQPPIYIEAVGGASPARGAAAAEAGEGSGGGGGGPSPRKGSANVHVSITTTLDGKLLRVALAQHGVMVSDLLRLAQGPFSLELGGALTPGSALEVQVPLQLAATAGRLARALRRSEEGDGGEAPVGGAALVKRRSLAVSKLL